MSDDPQVPSDSSANSQVSQSDTSSDQPSGDSMAELEALLNKAKAKRASGQDSEQPPESTGMPAEPAGPTQEEIQAQRLAELEQQERIAEVERQQQLEAQRQKMAEELQKSPQYQARQEQDKDEAAEAAEAKAAQEGHVIHQVGDDKV